MHFPEDDKAKRFSLASVVSPYRQDYPYKWMLNPDEYSPYRQQILGFLQTEGIIDKVFELLKVLEKLPRKTRLRNGKQDNLALHAIRIAYEVTRILEKDPFKWGKVEKEIAVLASLLHDLVDPKHIKRSSFFDLSDDSFMSAIGNVIQIERKQNISLYDLEKIIDALSVVAEHLVKTFDFKDYSYADQLAKTLVGMHFTEFMAEQIRYIQVVKNQSFPIVRMADLEKILTIQLLFGNIPLLIKTVEKLDNLSFPLPKEEEDAFKKMHEDAIEAYYFFIPFAEAIQQYELVANLKNKAVRFLSQELNDFYDATLTFFKEALQTRCIKLSLEAAQLIIKRLLELSQSQNPTITPLNQAESLFTRHLYRINYQTPPYNLIEKLPATNDTHEKLALTQKIVNALKNEHNLLPAVWFAEDIYRVCPLVYGRVKSFGSSLSKVLRYLIKQQLTPDLNNIRTLINNLPDLVGVTLITAALNQKMYAFLKELNRYNSYTHPLGGQTLEKFHSNLGREAIHFVFRPSKKHLRQVAMLLNITKEEDLILLSKWARKGIHVEIHILSPTNAIHASNFASHLAYEYYVKRRAFLNQPDEEADIQSFTNLLAHVRVFYRNLR